MHSHTCHGQSSRFLVTFEIGLGERLVQNADHRVCVPETIVYVRSVDQGGSVCGDGSTSEVDEIRTLFRATVTGGRGERKPWISDRSKFDGATQDEALARWPLLLVLFYGFVRFRTAELLPVINHRRGKQLEGIQ